MSKFFARSTSTNTNVPTITTKQKPSAFARFPSPGTHLPNPIVFEIPSIPFPSGILLSDFCNVSPSNHHRSPASSNYPFSPKNTIPNSQIQQEKPPPTSQTSKVGSRVLTTAGAPCLKGDNKVTLEEMPSSGTGDYLVRNKTAGFQRTFRVRREATGKKPLFRNQELQKVISMPQLHGGKEKAVTKVVITKKENQAKVESEKNQDYYLKSELTKIKELFPTIARKLNEEEVCVPNLVMKGTNNYSTAQPIKALKFDFRPISRPFPKQFFSPKSSKTVQSQKAISKGSLLLDLDSEESRRVRADIEQFYQCRKYHHQTSDIDEETPAEEESIIKKEKSKPHATIAVAASDLESYNNMNIYTCLKNKNRASQQMIYDPQGQFSSQSEKRRFKQGLMSLFKFNSVLQNFKADPIKQKNLIEAFLKANLHQEHVSEEAIYKMIGVLSLTNDQLARKYLKEKSFAENLSLLLEEASSVKASGRGSIHDLAGLKLSCVAEEKAAKENDNNNSVNYFQNSIIQEMSKQQEGGGQQRGGGGKERVVVVGRTEMNYREWLKFKDSFPKVKRKAGGVGAHSVSNLKGLPFGVEYENEKKEAPVIEAKGVSDAWFFKGIQSINSRSRQQLHQDKSFDPNQQH